MIFDKAYVDFAHLFDLLGRGVFWVTRAKDDLRYRVLKKLPKSNERAYPECNMFGTANPSVGGSIRAASIIGWIRFFLSASGWSRRGDSMMVLFEPHDQRRHERARQNIRCSDCEHDCFGQWDEQITGHSRKEKHRHKYDADTQR